MPRIAVVGVAVDDYIRRADGKVVRSLGGIAYSVSVMAALSGPDAEVLPVCRVAHAQRDRLLDEWSVFGNVSDLGLVPWAGPASQVTLEYQDGGRIGGDREERLLYPTPPLAAHKIDVALAADAILLNCVTGAVLTGGRYSGSRDHGRRFIWMSIAWYSDVPPAGFASRSDRRTGAAGSMSPTRCNATNRKRRSWPSRQHRMERGRTRWDDSCARRWPGRPGPTRS